jgi:hypothetical protein
VPSDCREDVDVIGVFLRPRADDLQTPADERKEFGGIVRSLRDEGIIIITIRKKNPAPRWRYRMSYATERTHLSLIAAPAEMRLRSSHPTKLTHSPNWHTRPRSIPPTRRHHRNSASRVIGTART